MSGLTGIELVERIFHEDYKKLKGRTLRMTRVRVPGREVVLANIITPSDEAIYRNLALNIGVHEGEDHSGETVGIISFTPWESVIAASDIAIKAANVELGFMDRFCGTMIITGELSAVETALKEVLRFFKEELSFPVCKLVKNS